MCARALSTASWATTRSPPTVRSGPTPGIPWPSAPPPPRRRPGWWPIGPRRNRTARRPPSRCAGLPAITPGGGNSAATAISTTRRSRPKPCAIVPSSGLPCSTSTITTATEPSRSSTSGPTWRSARFTPTRSRSFRTSAASPTKPGPTTAPATT